MPKKEYEDEAAEFEEDNDTEEENITVFKYGKNADTYSKKGRDELLENDEITPEEEGFTRGAAQDFATCTHCGKVMTDRKAMVEKKIGDKVYWFCSDRCATKGKSVR